MRSAHHLFLFLVILELAYFVDELANDRDEAIEMAATFRDVANANLDLAKRNQDSWNECLEQLTRKPDAWSAVDPTVWTSAKYHDPSFYFDAQHVYADGTTACWRYDPPRPRDGTTYATPRDDERVPCEELWGTREWRAAQAANEAK